MSPTHRFHPEFGYFCPTPSFRRKLRAISALLIFAAVAIATGTLMLNAAQDPALGKAPSWARFDQPYAQDEASLPGSEQSSAEARNAAMGLVTQKPSSSSRPIALRKKAQKTSARQKSIDDRVHDDFGDNPRRQAHDARRAHVTANYGAYRPDKFAVRGPFGLLFR